MRENLERGRLRGKDERMNIVVGAFTSFMVKVKQSK